MELVIIAILTGIGMVVVSTAVGWLLVTGLSLLFTAREIRPCACDAEGPCLYHGELSPERMAEARERRQAGVVSTTNHVIRRLRVNSVSGSTFDPQAAAAEEKDET